MTDEKTQQLENRIDKLESTIEKMMPSRRDALKMGGAALAGGSLMAGTASAGTNQVGTIGSQASPVDLESEDINNADTVTTENLVVNNTATGPFGSELQGCRVFLSSNQNFTNVEKVQLDQVEYDSGGNFDTTNHHFTCPETGVYLVKAQLVFHGGSDGDERRVRIGSTSDSVPSDSGANVRLPSNRVNSLQASTVNKYDLGDTIATYAANFVSNDELESGNKSRATHLEVVFLGSL